MGGTILATHMYIFECCFRPTSGHEFIFYLCIQLNLFCVWDRIRTYGGIYFSLGRLTVCCLKPLGHPNILFSTMSLVSDSNQQHLLYKSNALPIELTRRNAPKQFIFTPYLGLYRNLLSMASSFKRIQF